MEATNKERTRNEDHLMERERQVRSEFRQVVSFIQQSQNKQTHNWEGLAREQYP